MNNVILIGYLGNDAETRKTRNDSTLTTLSLATQCNLRDRESGAFLCSRCSELSRNPRIKAPTKESLK